MRKSLFWSSLDKQSRSRMLKDATHRSSTSFSVFTLIQIVRQTGISPLKHQIFSVSYLNRCWFSQLWPCYNCFHLLWVLGAVQRSYIWNIHHYLRLVHDLSCWSSGNKPSKEFSFLESTTLKNLNLCNFGLKITNLACFEPIMEIVYVPHGTSITL